MQRFRPREISQLVFIEIKFEKRCESLERFHNRFATGSVRKFLFWRTEEREGVLLNFRVLTVNSRHCRRVPMRRLSTNWLAGDTSRKMWRAAVAFGVSICGSRSSQTIQATHRRRKKANMMRSDRNLRHLIFNSGPRNPNRKCNSRATRIITGFVWSTGSLLRVKLLEKNDRDSRTHTDSADSVEAKVVRVGGWKLSIQQGIQLCCCSAPAALVCWHVLRSLFRSVKATETVWKYQTILTTSVGGMMRGSRTHTQWLRDGKKEAGRISLKFDMVNRDFMTGDLTNLRTDRLRSSWFWGVKKIKRTNEINRFSCEIFFRMSPFP